MIIRVYAYKIFIVLTLLITSFSFISKLEIVESDILGVYSTPNNKSKIEFEKRGDLFYGKLIWNVNPEIKDSYNSDESLRKENLIGQDIFKSIKYNKNTQIWTGKFYDTESGITYDCDLWFEYSKESLMVKGYLGTPMIGKTNILERIE
jgi:uncharacterized protein (DUF2147 family)